MFQLPKPAQAIWKIGVPMAGSAGVAGCRKVLKISEAPKRM
jgi:hypothetical protein